MSEAITRACVLSNGAYSLLVTPGGGGFSALNGIALTAWAPDPTAHSGGLACYIRDLPSRAYWSLAQTPCARVCSVGLARADGKRVEQSVRYDDIEAHCETFVLASMNADTRRVRLTNLGKTARSLELTTFAELALTSCGAYASHPAFAKLFVQTAFDAKRNALIAWRRQRSPDDQVLCIAQRLVAQAGTFEFDTDRARFLGRTRSPMEPRALASDQPLSGTVGTVLDPAFCLRTAFELAAGASAQLELVTFAATSRSELERMLDANVAGAHAGGAVDEAGMAALGLPDRWRAAIRFEPFDYRWAGTLTQSNGTSSRRTEYGAFSEDGSEYVLTVGRSFQPTPQPWINVVANETFGCLVSETGAGYTWAENSRENRITPWTNDAVTDAHSEALYIRDHESGECWSAFPGPAPADTDYVVRHGFGYSRFTSTHAELTLDAYVFVPRSDPLRIVKLALTNRARVDRRLSITSYAQLVLGAAPSDTRAGVDTTYDQATATLFATNSGRGEFSQRVAFATIVTNATNAARSATGSRASFIGAQGTSAAPAALAHDVLDGQFGAGLDPCAALQVEFTIAAGATLEFAFLLGEGANQANTRACVERYGALSAIDQAFGDVVSYWRDLLAGVQAQTPVRAYDVMLNGWLAYQNLACRMWARSAFYQSGGAFGFRDQLQDSAALLYLDPQMTRNQILLHAAHQFVEGDVLHWWHPPTSKGIRTRFSDDLLWLPYITAFYIASTGDRTILDESIRYLVALQLEPGDDEIFVWPRVSSERGSLYDHCCKAIDRSLTRGQHGLPLIGVGDWNDGMNRVGREGRGESVWLGFFLFDILHQFIPICQERADHQRARHYALHQAALLRALNHAGWDGEWYKRAYYDNGAALGSRTSDECRIDALAQAWAVLSRAAPGARARQAIRALKEQLVSERDGIIRLLTPAFDRTPHDPGYIKGYVPGVRENGGQYTHAAIWAVRALAEVNDRELAARLAEMLTPVSHTRDSRQVEIYKGEPYVVAADVYGMPPHVGRAGWTWYTGSAGWLYRVLLESILGFSLQDGQTIRLCPCIPADWPGFTLSYRFADGTRYTFDVEQHDQPTVTSDGRVHGRAVWIQAAADRGAHTVSIKLGRDVGPQYLPRQPREAP